MFKWDMTKTGLFLYILQVKQILCSNLGCFTYLLKVFLVQLNQFYFGCLLNWKWVCFTGNGLVVWWDQNQANQGVFPWFWGRYVLFYLLCILTSKRVLRHHSSVEIIFFRILATFPDKIKKKDIRKGKKIQNISKMHKNRGLPVIR